MILLQTYPQPHQKCRRTAGRQHFRRETLTFNVLATGEAQTRAHLLLHLLRLRGATCRRQAHEDLERVVNHPLEASERANHDNTKEIKIRTRSQR